MIDVIFRTEKDGEVVALFPHQIETREGNVLCYSRNGQHSHCDYTATIAETKPTKGDQYQDLKEELEAMGYELNVVKAQNQSIYRKNLINF